MVRDVPAHFMMQTGLFADDERSPLYSSGTEPKKLAIISLTTSTRNFQVHEFIKIQGERTENQIFTKYLFERAMPKPKQKMYVELMKCGSRVK